MFGSKLLETIRALRTSEIEEFLDSPFYNDRRIRKEVIALFEFIIEDHPVCMRDALEKEKTHTQIFGNKPFVENRLNHVMTALLRLLETFIVARFSNNFSEVKGNMALARFYSERELKHRFETVSQHLQDPFDKARQEDEEQLLLKFQIELLRHHQHGNSNPKAGDNNLIPVLRRLDAFYFTQRLIITTGLMIQKQVVKMDVSKTIEFYEYLSHWEMFHEEISEKPLAQAYFRLLPLLAEEAEMEDMQAFRNFLHENKSTLPLTHQKALYRCIRTWLSVRYNRGESDMLPLLFALQKDEYEQGFLFEENGSMRANTFQNIVTAALKLKSFPWIRAVMDECRNRLTGASEPEHEWTFNEANYLFHTGDLEGAIDTGFHLLKYDNFNYNLAARRLEIKIWFEKGDLEMAEYRLNALKSYLFSNKKSIPDQMKRNNDDFVDVFRQLMRPLNVNNPTRLMAIRENLNGERKHIAEREWFLEKLRLQ